MEPINIFNGKTVPLLNNNIDTDQIIPKAFLNVFLKQDSDHFYSMNGATFQMAQKIQNSI